MGTVDAPVAVGIHRLAGAWDEGLEGLASRRDARDRERSHRGAVVGDVAADHLVARWLADRPEVLARELPSRLDGLAPTGCEEDAIEITRGVIRQAIGELDALRVGVGPEGEVRELFCLSACSLGEFLPAVAHLDDEQAGEAIEVFVALRVVDVGAFAPLDDRDLVVLVVGTHAAEVQPEVVPCVLVELAVGAAFVRCHVFLFIGFPTRRSVSRGAGRRRSPSRARLRCCESTRRASAADARRPRR